MLRENGKRLVTREAYAHLLLSMEHERDDLLVNQYGAHTDPEHGVIVPVETAPGRFRFMPGPEFGPRLYRGQSQFFAPCRPSLYRRDAIEGMYWAAKTLELGALLWRHPVCEDFLSWNLEGLTFDLSLEAIAQHYGFPSVLLDFSRSKDVAMFFATCTFDPKAGKYYPTNSGIAVLYTANLRALLLDPKRVGTIPLGFEPLPRPEAQLAFAVPLGLDEDLNHMAWVTAEKIELTPDLSRRYFDMFDGGKTLFPENPVDRQIEALRDSRSVSLSALKMAVTLNILPSHPHGVDGVIREFRAAGFDVPEIAASLDEPTIAAAASDWNNRRESFLNRIRIRGMSEHVAVE